MADIAEIMPQRSIR